MILFKPAWFIWCSEKRGKFSSFFPRNTPEAVQTLQGGTPEAASTLTLDTGPLQGGRSGALPNAVVCPCSSCLRCTAVRLIQLKNEDKSVRFSSGIGLKRSKSHHPSPHPHTCGCVSHPRMATCEGRNPSHSLSGGPKHQGAGGMTLRGKTAGREGAKQPLEALPLKRSPAHRREEEAPVASLGLLQVWPHLHDSFKPSQREHS